MEELAIGWLKSQRKVGGVLVGTRNAEQSEALTSLIDITLDNAIVDELSKATEKLKTVLGSNIDMWDVVRTR